MKDLLPPGRGGRARILAGGTDPDTDPGQPSPVPRGLPASPVDAVGAGESRPSPLELRRDGKHPGHRARHPRPPRGAGPSHARAPADPPRNSTPSSETPGRTPHPENTTRPLP